MITFPEKEKKLADDFPARASGGSAEVGQGATCRDGLSALAGLRRALCRETAMTFSVWDDIKRGVYGASNKTG